MARATLLFSDKAVYVTRTPVQDFLQGLDCRGPYWRTVVVEVGREEAQSEREVHSKVGTSQTLRKGPFGGPSIHSRL